MQGRASEKKKNVVVGQFAGPHGVRGQFKIRSYTELPEDVAAYGPVQTGNGKCLTLTLLQEVKPGLFLASAPEIATREDCDGYKGALLSVARGALPAPEGEDDFYQADLIGLRAVSPDGEELGLIKAVVNYGAGDILELINVPDRKGTVLIPFTKEDVPVVDIQNGQLTVLLPEEDELAERDPEV